MTGTIPARIHLLPARVAPIAAIIRRKPSRCFHVMRWNTSTDRIEHGSWFRGKLFPLRADVSSDGEWMVYLASGAGRDTWNGVCRLPRWSGQPGDSQGQLLAARSGSVERYTPANLAAGKPAVRICFEHLQPPQKPAQETAPIADA